MPNNQPHQVKKRFLQLRKKYGTQEQFGQASGLKQSQVSQYESGDRPISDGAYALMEHTLKLNRSWLENGEGKMFLTSQQPAHTPQTDIGSRLRYIRQSKQLTTEEMARQLGVAGSSINRYEKGGTSVPQSKVEKLIKVFNINTEWLYTGKGQPYNTEEVKQRPILDVAAIHQQLQIFAERSKAQDMEIAKLKARVTQLERDSARHKLQPQH